MRYLIDGEESILGRMSSKVAKLLIEGNEVYLVNAEKIRITGHVPDLVAKYKRRIELKDKANPEHSPHYSRRPDLLVKRVIRGMLPYKQPKGKTAYKLLKVYMGPAKDIKDAKKHDIGAKQAKETFENSMTILELAEKLGYQK
ncbi:MAG TPA: 50S ribosomal protein L13 [Candidatus Saccharimonadales bacterium]|nr:50S ribosomal protein L13 [Candidatus Saccharimonadales bacterium]